MTMNERAERLVLAMFDDPEALRVRRHPGAVDVLDCGVEVRGGLAAGLLLARVCLGDLGTVSLVPSTIAEWPGPAVQVTTDDPVRACLAAQYAGRQVALGKFYAQPAEASVTFERAGVVHHLDEQQTQHQAAPPSLPIGMQQFLLQIQAVKGSC